jgi:hypothetical protein
MSKKMQVTVSDDVFDILKEHSSKLSVAPATLATIFISRGLQYDIEMNRFRELLLSDETSENNKKLQDFLDQQQERIYDSTVRQKKLKLI